MLNKKGYMKNNLHALPFLISSLSILLIFGWTAFPVNSDFPVTLNFEHPQLIAAKQMILVFNENPNSPLATAYFYEKRQGRWIKKSSMLPANIGKKGFASLHKKKEGDGKSPSGIFSITTAFGYNPNMDTALKYISLNNKHKWVDDVNSKFYNQLIEQTYFSGSYETMRRRDHLYEHGLVLNYNTNPIIKGKGSAIFIHVERRAKSPTAGCVSFPQKVVLQLLNWLEPNKNPVIVMGTRKTLEKL